MTTPTFEIVRTRLKLTGGTKFYELMIISSSEGGTLLSLRYGKVNSFGQMQVEYHAGKKDAVRAFEKKRSEKEKRGYELVAASDHVSKVSIAVGDLPLAVGSAYYKMGAENLHKLHPKLSIKGVNDPVLVKWTKDGEKIEKPPRMIEEDNSAFEAAEREKAKKLAEAEQNAKRAIQEKYEKNPMYGAFS